MKAVHSVRDFVRFRYPMSDSDTLLIRSHEDTGTSIGPYDTGFAITRNGKEIQSVNLSELPEVQNDPNFAENSATLAVTLACSSAGPIYFVSIQYKGDEISPALVLTLVPSGSGYEISTLPTISGGVVEVSKADPRHIRTWDNLHEGSCNACDTAYRITEYEIRDGKPVRIRNYRTRHFYNSGNDIFDDRRRIRFIP